MRAELIVIENEDDYREACARIAALMEATAPADVARLRAQALLVAAFEAEQAPPVPPDAIEAIRFRMEQQELALEDIAPALGGIHAAREVLARRRPLTLSMIRRLRRLLDIPADVLIGGDAQGARRTPAKADS